jgi:pimeloyl-ACP methyl ester carboxylesterase
MADDGIGITALRVRGAGPLLSYEVVGPTVATWGASPITLLCVHGNSSHRGVWRLVARELPEFRCILLDLRGHGGSEHVVPAAYDPEHSAADIAQVVATLALAPYAILGHSAGALASARFIATVDVAAAPVAFVWVDIDPLVPRWQVTYFRERVASMTRVFATVEDALGGFRRMYPNIPPDRLQAFVTEGLRSVDGGWRMKLDPATYATWEPGDLRPDLPNIRVPTLVLRGATSIGGSAEGVVDLQRGLPHCEAREIEGGSHMVLLEYPEVLAASVRDFLRRHAGATRASLSHSPGSG